MTNNMLEHFADLSLSCITIIRLFVDQGLTARITNQLAQSFELLLLCDLSYQIILLDELPIEYVSFYLWPQVDGINAAHVSNRHLRGHCAKAMNPKVKYHQRVYVCFLSSSQTNVIVLSWTTVI